MKVGEDIKFKESDEKSIYGDEEEKTASNGKASEAIDPWYVSKEEVTDENDSDMKVSDNSPEQPQSTESADVKQSSEVTDDTMVSEAAEEKDITSIEANDNNSADDCDKEKSFTITHLS